MPGVAGFPRLASAGEETKLARPGRRAAQPAPPSAEHGVCRCGSRRPVGVVLGLRSGARPRLDGQWFCRKACLLDALRERARRDFPDAGVPLSRVRHRVPLGLMLQARGVVSARELQEALKLQEVTGYRLGDVLRNCFGVAEERITGAIAAQWGLPVLELPLSPSSALQHLAPSRLFQASGTFAVEQTETGLLLACAEGPDPALALALERMHPVRVEFGVVSSSALDQWRKAQDATGVPARRISSANREALAAEAAELLYRLQPVDAHIVRVNGLWWMRVWLEEAARRNHTTGGGTDTMDVLLTVSAGSAGTRSADA